jgi:hypothetical protein
MALPVHKASGDSEPLEDYWSEVRCPKRSRRSKASEVPVLATIAPLVTWAVAEEKSRSACRVVPGLEGTRQYLFQQFALGEWRRFQRGYVVDLPSEGFQIDKGFLSYVTSRIERLAIPSEAVELLRDEASLPKGSWEVLWALVLSEDFIVEDPLREIVDQSFYLMHDLYRALWEARFLVRESSDLKPAAEFLGTVIRWMTGVALTANDLRVLERVKINRLVETDLERFDVLCFLLTLAGQNDLIYRTLLIFDRLEDVLGNKVVLRQLHLFLLSIERWTHIGLCPLGVVLGFRGLPVDFTTLHKAHPKLAKEVEANFCGVRS